MLDNIRYLRHNWQYELTKWREDAALWVARHLPTQVRVWVVVDATGIARQLYPHPKGLDSPDGLGYSEIYDGARRMRGN